MTRSFEFRQGLTHAVHMFEGAVLDSKGALVIISNLEATLPHRPPQYAEGIAEAVRRVRAAIGQEVQQ